MLNPTQLALKEMKQRMESELENADSTVRSIVKDLVIGVYMKEHDMPKTELALFDSSMSYDDANDTIQATLVDKVSKAEIWEDSFDQNIMPETIALLKQSTLLREQVTKGGAIAAKDIRALKTNAQGAVDELYVMAAKGGLGWCPTCKPSLFNGNVDMVVGV